MWQDRTPAKIFRWGCFDAGIPSSRKFPESNSGNLPGFLSWWSDFPPRADQLSAKLTADKSAENRRPFELVVGFEPTTCGLRNRCSTAELHQQIPSRHSRTKP